MTIKIIWKFLNYSSKTFKCVLIFLVFLALLASRRWSQLKQPEVWSEDGLVVIPGYINDGLLTFLEPVNGYLITASKIISVISLSISFSNYNVVSTIISCFFIVLVALAINYSPTYLRHRLICALSVFLYLQIRRYLAYLSMHFGGRLFFFSWLFFGMKIVN